MLSLRGSPLRVDVSASSAIAVGFSAASTQLNAGAHLAHGRSNPEADATIDSKPDEIELFLTQEIDDFGSFGATIEALDAGFFVSPVASLGTNPSTTPSEAAA